MASQEIPAICFICEKNLQDKDTVDVTREMGTLIDASKKHHNGKVKYLEGESSVIVHKDCRNRYTKNWNVEAAVRCRQESHDSKVNFKVYLK